jgi:hypothetical protein
MAQKNQKRATEHSAVERRTPHSLLGMREVPEPPHHYWVTERTLLVFANKRAGAKKGNRQEEPTVTDGLYGARVHCSKP